MKKVGMNMLVKALALPLLAVPLLSSCMVENENPENKFNTSSNEPAANYRVIGKVTDVEGDPIAGIRVIADYSTDVVYRADTLYTDRDGQYSKFLTTPRVSSFYMSFDDIDGQANGGEFEPRSERVNPIRTEISSGYFGGSYVVSLNATLKRK
ncbi:MAG TPA: hypothetical protein DDX40_09170 [Rikenellaceae bacterium]|nr:hypothetical protein [Rikenellaceae bacterium]